MKQLAAALLAFALLAGLVASPVGDAQAQAPGSASGIDLPITGTGDNGESFEGVFTLTRFVNQNGELFAEGTLTGTLTNAEGAVIGTVTDLPVTLPASNAGSTCDILDLNLGPLDLDLLGLIVHLDPVNLTIDAEQGPGNLLGNLLCAVTGLLDQGGGSTSGLANLLNRILSIL